MSLRRIMDKIFSLLIIGALLLVPVTPATADLRASPGWWDSGSVGSGEDWHYRVPVTIAAGAHVNATVKVDVDFATLLGQMGVSGSFDANSVRVVRSTGALATEQEFTDSIYAGATDSTGNGRGEVRFILQDTGPATYYIYFDITANGSKSANPQTPINGNFETGSVGTQLPSGWATAAKTNAAYDMQISASENPSITSNGSSITNNPYTTDGTPRTGAHAYLIGARTNNEPTNSGASQADATMLTRTIKVPATNPGTLTIRWRPEGWDSDTNNVTTFDNIHVRLVGSSTTEIVGPATNDYVNRPFSPNYGGSVSSSSVNGYGHYNGYDMDRRGRHKLGMTVAYHAEPWWTYSYSLAPYAGQTITLRIGTTHMESYKSWFHIDDIEWSVVNGTLGTPQGFGVNVTSPAASATLAPGQTLSIMAQVDAAPSSITANVYDNAGTLVASGITLYNNGTHGDTTANDSLWVNDGSVSGNPTYVIPLATASSSGWIIRVFAKDGSTSTIGVANGLIDIPPPATAAETQTNFYNIDEIVFNIARANLTVDKSSMIINDPVNGTGANRKLIPGATVRYCILISNAGSATATSINATDNLPSTLSYIPGSMKSGSACLTAATTEDDDATGADDSDTIGASYAAGLVTIIAPILAAASSLAVLIDAKIN